MRALTPEDRESLGAADANDAAIDHIVRELDATVVEDGKRETEDVPHPVETADPESAPTSPSATRGATVDARVRLFTVDELAALPPPRYLLRPLLVAGGLAVLYGRSGSMKTFLALGWALSIATGRPWLDRYDVEQGPVVYVLAEGASGLLRRIAAWSQHNDRPSLDAVRIVPHATPLDDPRTVDEIAEHVRDLGAHLLVIDTLARSSGALDENATRDMNRIVAALDRIGCARLLVHHTGHDTSRERGSSVLRGAADTLLELRRGEDALTLVVDKQKDAQEPEPISLAARRIELDGLADEDGHPLASVVLAAADETRAGSALSEAARTALDVLAQADAGDGLTTPEWRTLALEARLTRPTFYRTRKTLIETGRVRVASRRDYAARDSESSDDDASVLRLTPSQDVS